MGDTANQYGVQAVKITFTALLLCLFCWLSFADAESSISSPFVVADTSALSETSDHLAVSYLSYSSASYFEHHKQSAKWQFDRTDETLFTATIVNVYSLTEPIFDDWFLNKPASRFHLSGWKDTGIQFKIKNAFI